MKIYHISAECYPIAKTGGLGDVVGALPKYQNLLGIDSSVIMPWYDKPFLQEYKSEEIFSGQIQQGNQSYPYSVWKLPKDVLSFEVFLVKIPGLLDRKDVYGFPDEANQFIAFQHALLNWICHANVQPDLFHCHDHHTGLIPFFIENCYDFHALKGIPTVGTVHNGQYQGWMSWENAALMPAFDSSKGGLLDWYGTINPLAAMIKCCWAYNTVSTGYLQELFVEANGLEGLFVSEKAKGYGIINGIDGDIWNPENDPFIESNYTAENFIQGKQENKKTLCKQYGLDFRLPLVAFIGRFAIEKGADLLAPAIEEIALKFKGRVNVLILGSGDSEIENLLRQIQDKLKQNIAVIIGYDERLSHQIYASADFIIMPSRVEPCGLNQLYAMKYGTIPIVRKIGGLRDTVIDLARKNPNGIVFKEAAVKDMISGVRRALTLYKDSARSNELRETNMGLDYSWNNSAAKYVRLYKNLINRL